VASRVSQMDEHLMWAAVPIVLLIVVLYIQLMERTKFSDGADGLHERLDVLEDSLSIVAQVLEKLPEIMPSFHLPQAHPLQALLEFLQMMRGEGEPSSEDAALRGPEGRFSDGDSSTEESSGAGESIP
jgi:hypothetical protein